MIRITFTPWSPIRAIHDKAAINDWLAASGRIVHFHYRSKMEASRGGRVYRKRGGLHTASAPGAYLAKETGALIGSIRVQQTATEVEIGTSKDYVKYFITGGPKMKKRKLSAEAMKETRAKRRAALKPWGRFQVG